jgi:hypothetical protein
MKEREKRAVIAQHGLVLANYMRKNHNHESTELAGAPIELSKVLMSAHRW